MSLISSFTHCTNEEESGEVDIEAWGPSETPVCAQEALRAFSSRHRRDKHRAWGMGKKGLHAA
ncbi:MAG: hypothetical protein D5S03_05430 [Desulfonatronospira sp. MSAO_Bac3]|nr:MAG: hypothetical protein D5S03_05430 [Desulfonatronospira sp. MSAO_Bac3]